MDDIPQENSSTGPKNDNFLAISILVAGLMVSGSIIYLVRGNGGGTGQAQKQPAAIQPSAGNTDVSALLKIRDRDVILGDPKAPVTLIEYGDYQCPFCGRFFSQTEPLIRADYIKNGKVKMIYRNLAFLGQESILAAQATECSKDQGKFWSYHDAIYGAEIKDGQENSGNLTRELFIKLAGQNSFDINSFTQCLDSKKYADVVSKETSEAQGLGVNSTPTLFVNSQKIQGAVPYAQFKAAIDNFLKTD